MSDSINTKGSHVIYLICDIQSCLRFKFKIKIDDDEHLLLTRAQFVGANQTRKWFGPDILEACDNLTHVN